MEVIANSLSSNVGNDCLWEKGWDIKWKNSDNAAYQHSICLLNTKASNSIFPFVDNTIKLMFNNFENLLLGYLNSWISSFFVLFLLPFDRENPTNYIKKGSSYKSNEPVEKLIEVILNKLLCTYCEYKVWINSDVNPPLPCEIPNYCEVDVFVHDLTAKLSHNTDLFIQVSFFTYSFYCES